MSHPTSANLPAVAPSGFPVSYEEARQAIAKCESPFECRTMADKAAAMAVYARMRDDADLLNRAVRLQAWAARRWGELDKALHPDRRQENLRQSVRNVVDHNSVEQLKKTDFIDQPQSGKRPAPPDGTTEYQRVVSRRLAAIPEAEFSRQVESDTPPTVAQLADQGKARRTPPPKTDPPLPRTAAQMPAACAALIDFVKCCERQEPVSLARTLDIDDARALRQWVAKADHWLALFVMSLAE
jgi:hypothetical protein